MNPNDMNHRIIHHPTVRIIGRQTLDDRAIQEFIGDVGGEAEKWVLDASSAGEALTEVAGRVCYMSYGRGRKTNREFLQNILSSGHGSVLEHAVWTMLITGVSRSLTHELVRHRHFSYSQLSQRYVDESEVMFVMPEEIRENVNMYGTWVRSISTAETAYRILVQNLEELHAGEENKTLRRKLARQVARSVLPNCTETKIVVTGNARAWRHFCELRGSIHADREIRRLSVTVLRLLQKEAGGIFGDMTIKRVSDTDEIIESGYNKI